MQGRSHVRAHRAVIQDSERILAILSKAKKLAREYRALTGRPLGITGEVAEYEAARIMRLKLTPARTAGYDAIGLPTAAAIRSRADVFSPVTNPGSGWAKSTSRENSTRCS